MLFGRVSIAARGLALRGKFGRNQHKSALTAKRGNRLYQKGKNVPIEGKVNSRGKFIPDPKKQFKIVIPEASELGAMSGKLKPYVDSSTPLV